MARLRGSNRLVRLSGGTGLDEPLVVGQGAKGVHEQRDRTADRTGAAVMSPSVRVCGRLLSRGAILRWAVQQRRDLQRALRGADPLVATELRQQRATLEMIRRRMRDDAPVLTSEEQRLLATGMGLNKGADPTERRRAVRPAGVVWPIGDSLLTPSELRTVLYRLATSFEVLGESRRGRECRASARKIPALSDAPVLPWWLVDRVQRAAPAVLGTARMPRRNGSG